MATALTPRRHASRCSASTSSTVASSGMLTVLEMAQVVDRVVAHRAGEDRQVLGLEGRRADDRLVHVDVVDDGRHLVLGVAEDLEGARHGLVDDGHVAATAELP